MAPGYVRRWIALIALAAALGAAPACRHSEPGEHGASHAAGEHEHHEEGPPPTEESIDMPRDFAGAVARIAAYCDQIQQALRAGRPAEAHRPLDEVDLVLGKLMLLARDSGVARREWEAINLARRDLRRQFDLAHAAIDEDRPVDLPTLEQGLVAPLEQLRRAAAMASSSAAPSP